MRIAPPFQPPYYSGTSSTLYWLNWSSEDVTVLMCKASFFFKLVTENLPISFDVGGTETSPVCTYQELICTIH